MAYDRLKREIASGEVSPGEPLPIMALATRLGIGPSPVREALNRLASERLVELHDHRGFRAATLDVESLRDFGKASAWIYEAAIRAAIREGDPSWEDRMILSFHRMRRVESASQTIETDEVWSESFDGLLAALVSGCGSKWMSDCCQQITDVMRRYRLVYFQAVPNRSSSLQAWHQIIEAAIGRDADRTAELLLAQFANTENAIAAFISSQDLSADPEHSKGKLS